VEKIRTIGVTFLFKENYLEIVNRLGLGGFLFPQKTVISYKNIASVDANIATGSLSIETTGGKTYKYRTGFLAGKVRDKILSKVAEH